MTMNVLTLSLMLMERVRIQVNSHPSGIESCGTSSSRGQCTIHCATAPHFIWTASSKNVSIAYANSEGSGVPAQPHSLARIFIIRSYKHYENPLQNARPLVPSLRGHANSNILRIFPSKNENFQMKNSSSFHIVALNIDCGYSLEPPRRGGSNKYPQSMFLSRNKKNNVYPCKLQFYHIKLGLRGSKLYRHVFVMLSG